MFVDASAILAILTEEPGGEALARALERGGEARRITSVLAVWEAVVGLSRIRVVPLKEARERIIEFLAAARVDVVDVGSRELPIALSAYDRYGRHRFPKAERNKGLNIADCFHYACAKRHGATLLHKDSGFALVDLKSAGGF